MYARHAVNGAILNHRNYPLGRLLPPEGMLNEGDLLSLFLEYIKEKNLDLYPAQEDAILALYEGKNVVLNTPTGSGKSLVATALHFQSLALGRRSMYTCPIKALVNEKFLALCKEFGPELVGMITGDATVNGQAPIICCTAEILSNMALRDGEHAPVVDVIMDEFHYYADRERGVAWQIPLLTLPRARFLIMSATLGETAFFESELTRLTGRETVLVKTTERPVPLDFIYKETPLHETIPELLKTGRAPIYLVNFTQRDCAEEAQNLLSVDFATKEEKKVLAEAMTGVRFTSPYGKDIQRLLRHGIGIHHAGLLPKYRVLVEGLAQKGLLKVIAGTDTLGVGVNIPIRTVLFTKLCKYDGEKTGLLTVRDFKQISGRAGRKGFDDKGTVVAQAPAHVIENLIMTSKAANDPKKAKKLVKKKPPEKGFVMWTKETFEKLNTSPPEALVSRFQVTHGMLLNVLGREQGGGCQAMRQLIRDSHDTPAQKERHRKTAFQLFRSLVERDIIRFEKQPGRKADLRLNVNLQEDFSLNQALSLYLLDTLKLLDPQAPDFAMNVVTLVESILENPELILRRQLDELRNRKFHELKSAGVEYDERLEELEKIEYPKPLRDFIYDTFNEFARVHPWVGQENIRPKSVAREMFELFYSFNDYVKEYDLQRSEGLLLRYLSEVYKVLVQTVPPLFKTPEVEDIAVFLGAMIRQVDSSLLDEWERLRTPGYVPKDEAAPELGETDITTDARAFTVLVRNETFRIVRAFARLDWDMLLSVIEPERLPEAPWSRQSLEDLLAPYKQDHTGILTGPDARGPQAFRVNKSADSWDVEQTLFDPDGHNDWHLKLTVDLAKSRVAGHPVLALKGLEAMA